MKKHIKLFEEITTPLEEAGGKKKGEPAAVSAPRPHTGGNYALETAKDFHMRELIGDIEEEFEKYFPNDEAKKDKSRKEIAAIWIESLQDWANGTY